MEEPPQRSADRVRQVPHIEGNFSTHVFVSLSRSLTADLEKFLPFAADSEPISGAGCTIPRSSLHLSLSRHVFLKPHLIHSFLKRMSQVFSSAPTTSLYLKDRLRYYTNESGDTIFVAVPIDDSLSPNVIALIKMVDSVFVEFDLQPFYDSPSPHISLAWGPNSQGLSFDEGNCFGGKIIVEDLDEFRVDVESICVAVGKEVHRIHLRS